MKSAAHLRQMEVQHARKQLQSARNRQAASQYNNPNPATLNKIPENNQIDTNYDDGLSMAIDFDANGISNAGAFFGGDGLEHYPADRLDALEPDIARARFLAGIQDYGTGLDVVYGEGLQNIDDSEPAPHNTIDDEAIAGFDGRCSIHHII